MPMRFFGYPKRTDEPTELSEVTLIASPKQLRKIAAFLLNAADGIEQRGMGWEHEHLADKVPGFRGAPGFIVFNQQHATK
jgi:hypothetical protein